jgi:hypothetical protein
MFRRLRREPRVTRGRFRRLIDLFESPLMNHSSEEAGPAVVPVAPATWVPPGHFYSPIVDVQALRERAAVVFDPQAPVPQIDLRLPEQLALFRQLAAYYPDLPFGDAPGNGLRYGYVNAAFSYGDALILATMIRHWRPRRIIEVGSGHSSCVTLDINERYFGNAIDCTFIEPYPELLRSLVKPEDLERVEIIDMPVQGVATERFAALEAGDILFIDSTHVTKSDSDVNHHFFRILPALKDGVIVHFHDIFYPFEYPPNWFFDENRSWNELYLLRAFLMYNRSFEVMFFNDCFRQKHRDVVAELMPKFLLNTGGSFWMRKVAPAA